MNQTLLLALAILLLLLALILFCRRKHYVAALWFGFATFGSGLSGLTLLLLWWFGILVDPPKPSRVSQAAQQGQPTLRGPQLPMAALIAFQNGSGHMIHRVDAASIQPLANTALADAPVHLATGTAGEVFVATANGVFAAPASASQAFTPIPVTSAPPAARITAIAVQGSTLFATIESGGKTYLFVRDGTDDLRATGVTVDGSVVRSELHAGLVDDKAVAVFLVATGSEQQLHLAATGKSWRLHAAASIDHVVVVRDWLVFTSRKQASEDASLWRASCRAPNVVEPPNPLQLAASAGDVVRHGDSVLAAIEANSTLVLATFDATGRATELPFADATGASRVYGLASVGGRACALTNHGGATEAWRQDGVRMTREATLQVANVIPRAFAATTDQMVFATETSLYASVGGTFKRLPSALGVSDKAPIQHLRGLVDCVLFESIDLDKNTNVYRFVTGARKQ